MDNKNSGSYEKLSKKWVSKHREFQTAFWEKHGDIVEDFVNGTKNFAIGSVSALMLLSSPVAGYLQPNTLPAVEEQRLPVEKNVFLVSDLSSFLPKEVRALTPDEESSISGILSRDFGFKIVPELSGIRLNRSYGYVGAEQHLMLYPGDNIETHFEDSDSSQTYNSGMAPGLGAWGYFAPSKEALTQKDIEREKYYIATQTFLAPGFAEHTGEYISFFKYRKMLVVNPENGKAVVAVIGDAGPGESTGKQLGGSPEVMTYLERKDGQQKGPVLYFFIDDPGDKIPLGPVEIK